MGANLTRRLELSLASIDAANELQSALGRVAPFGTVYFVDTSEGADGNPGTSPSEALATMAEAFDRVESGDAIYVRGDVREELENPLGVYGVKIIGAHGGRTRHDNGVRWREPASGATTGGALLTLREQGWEVHNILFVPKSDGTALRLRRAEDATYPDGSHAVISGCKFIGAATATTRGLEDLGGCHHVLVSNCEFHTLADALGNTSTSIANPLRWIVEDCVFIGNTDSLVMPFTESIVRRCVFDHATQNLVLSGGAGTNFALDNQLSEAAASVTINNGYAAGTSGVWRNFATDAIDYSVPA